MIEEQVVVTAIEKNGAWVEGVQQSACGSCSAKAGCGQHAMSQLGRKVSLWMAFDPNASNNDERRLLVGQQIVVGLPEGAILKSTLSLYGIPLLALLLGAVLGNALWGEAGSILLACGGMLLGFKVAQYWASINQRQWQPRFLRTCTHAGSELIQPINIQTGK